jgi:hypothetical protein
MKKLIVISLIVILFISCNQNSVLSDDDYIEANESELMGNSTTENSDEQDTYVQEIHLPVPPEINAEMSENRRKKLFNNGNCRQDKLDYMEACDYRNYDVKNYAMKVVKNNAGNFNIGQVCDIFDEAQNKWTYTNDPMQRTYENDYRQKASNVISNGFYGDCDDFAVVVCAMILSIGGEARINDAWGDDSGHAFTELNLGKLSDDEYLNISKYITKRYNLPDDFDLSTRVDYYGNFWLNLDWFADDNTGKRHPASTYFKFNRGVSYYILQGFCERF